MNNYFAEIIESSLDHYTAQSWQWDNYPTFGSLVQVQDAHKTIFGIVSHIQTGSIDPTRSPYPYQKTEAELRAEQPQIFEFLKTTFLVQIVGYTQMTNQDKIFYILPPTPCKIHSFVAPCTHSQAIHFFTRPDFLHLLFAFYQNIPNLDELLLAMLKHLLHEKIFDLNTLDSFCQIFTLQTGNDYRRLKLFLQRVEALV